MTGKAERLVMRARASSSESTSTFCGDPALSTPRKGGSDSRITVGAPSTPTDKGNSERRTSSDILNASQVFNN